MENSIVSEEEKKQINKILENIISQEWEPESCMQEFYSAFFISPHYNFYHKGHEYFITTEKDLDRKDVWIIYDRDLTDENYKYNSIWDNEPKSIYSDLSELAFEYKLKNDGRTLSEYIADYNHLDRSIVAEPIDKNKVGKIWRH
ncbi:MAG: hypothetical protein IKX70_02185 [Treponema sp.]|nr:hypothetical protein [Treponema sp.]